MHKETFKPDEFPESSVTVRPLTAAAAWDLRMGGLKGSVLQEIFMSCVTAWENAPVHASDDVVEKYDPTKITRLDMDFVLAVVMHARDLSTMSENERKNSASQS